jgi:hypothetical protein
MLLETHEGIMELLNRNFTSQAVAAATGLEPKAIQNWTSRGLIVGQRDGTGKGRHMNFSWFNVMEIAIAAELIEFNVSVQSAFAVAQMFSHASSGGAQWAGDDGISDDSEPFRYPGLPWHHNLGKTYIFVWKDGFSIRLLNDVGQVSLATIAPYPHRKTAYMALAVSEIFDHVCFRIGEHPNKLLDEAYPDQATKV